mmetsp:Transcript_4789/g.11946  ORF Transcript_4789/g.11946 Transcript_4789/m.11946 type:complete len:461 (+) Transcript_4789:1926-3308(+)
MASTSRSSAARPKRSASISGMISGSAASTSSGSAPGTAASSRENRVAPRTCVMKPRSRRLDRRDTTRGRCAAPSPAAAAASAVRAESRTPCARLLRQLAILPSTRPMSESRSRAGRRRRREMTAAEAAGRTVPPLPSLSSTTVRVSSSGSTSTRNVVTTTGCTRRATTLDAHASPSSSSMASSASSSHSWKFSNTVAAARMCSVFDPSTLPPPRDQRDPPALRSIHSNRSRYEPHGSAVASDPMAAAAVDATSAPASPRDATAKGARKPLMVTGGMSLRSAAAARRRSARQRRCACRCAMLPKKSCSGSLASASDAAPGAAAGHVSASRRKIASASERVVDSGERSSPRTPGASTPMTAPARDASAAAAAAAARDAADVITTTAFAFASASSPPATSASSSPSPSSSSSSSTTSPTLAPPAFAFVFLLLEDSDSATAASRKRSSAAAAACRSAMSEPRSS